MTFLNLFIINKSGGLIYNTALSPSAPTLSINDWLRIGSTFHSLHAIAVQASPALPPSTTAPPGIESIAAGALTLKCLQTATGIKFVLTAETGTAGDMYATLQSIYELYADYALKNPFYELEMPIRCELFTTAVTKLTSGRR